MFRGLIVIFRELAWRFANDLVDAPEERNVEQIETHDTKYDDLGIITVSYEVFRADDEQLVLYCEHLQTVKYRDAATARLERIEASA